jgi:hypothetical protein
MNDAETQAALERVNDRNLWSKGWFLCVVVTLFAVARIAVDWHLRGLAGKLTAGPTGSVSHGMADNRSYRVLKRRKRVSGGALFVGVYMLPVLAMQAFGPLARAR